jgi:hypothetical protein
VQGLKWPQIWLQNAGKNHYLVIDPGSQLAQVAFIWVITEIKVFEEGHEDGGFYGKSLKYYYRKSQKARVYTENKVHKT